MTTAELYVRDGSRFIRYGTSRPARPVPPIPTPVTLPDETPGQDSPSLTRIVRRDIIESVPRPDGKAGNVAILTRTVDTAGQVVFVRRDRRNPWGGISSMTAVVAGDPGFTELESRYHRGGAR